MNDSSVSAQKDHYPNRHKDARGAAKVPGAGPGGHPLRAVRGAPDCNLRQAAYVLFRQQEIRIAMKAKLLLTALLGAAFVLSGCATVKGLGRDIESVGQAGSDAINR